MLYNKKIPFLFLLPLLGFVLNSEANVARCPGIQTTKYQCCEYKQSLVWLDMSAQGKFCNKQADSCTVAKSLTYDDPGSKFDANPKKWVKLTEIWGKNGCRESGHSKSKVIAQQS